MTATVLKFTDPAQERLHNSTTVAPTRSRLRFKTPSRPDPARSYRLVAVLLREKLADLSD